MLVGDCNELKRELFGKFKEIEAVVRSAEHSDVGIPVPASNEVRYAGFHYIKADEELSNGHKEEAVEEMQRAVRHARKALFNVQTFRLLFYLRNARAVFAELRGNEDLAYTHIPNYKEHSKNFYEIRKFGKDAKSYDEDSVEFNATIYEEKIKKIRAFLADFEVGEMKLFAAMDKRSILRGKAVRILVTVIAVILGAMIGGLICALVARS